MGLRRACDAVSGAMLASVKYGRESAHRRRRRRNELARATRARLGPSGVRVASHERGLRSAWARFEPSSALDLTRRARHGVRMGVWGRCAEHGGASYGGGCPTI